MCARVKMSENVEQCRTYSARSIDIRRWTLVNKISLEGMDSLHANLLKVAEPNPRDLQKVKQLRKRMKKRG